MARVIDADAHIVEGRDLMMELMQRFPDKIRLANPGEETALFI
jgi:hypothetical protein